MLTWPFGTSFNEIGIKTKEVFISKVNAFENVFVTMSALLALGQWVNSLVPRNWHENLKKYDSQMQIYATFSYKV